MSRKNVNASERYLPDYRWMLAFGHHPDDANDAIRMLDVDLHDAALAASRTARQADVR